VIRAEDVRAKVQSLLDAGIQEVHMRPGPCDCIRCELEGFAAWLLREKSADCPDSGHRARMRHLAGELDNTPGDAE
jgi:hypothetical protein